MNKMLFLHFDRNAVSDNSAYIILRRLNKRTMSPEGRKWKQLVIETTEFEMRKQGVTRSSVANTWMRIRVTVGLTRSSIWRGDCHNQGKLLLDGICNALDLDDRYSIETSFCKALSKNAFTDVSIEFVARDMTVLSI